MMLYIHIPFCVSRCSYCAFYSTTRTDVRQRYVDALCTEIEQCLTEPPTTIYIGGGTPSTLTEAQLRQLISHVDTTGVVEFTIECNPDDITGRPPLDGFHPAMRYSLGIQTFDDARLKALHRRHTARQAITAVNTLKPHNTSIDLIYALPGQTLGEWERDIQQAIALDVDHISAYCLSYDEGTALTAMKERGDVQEVDEETARQMFYTLKEMLGAAGYEHYEISNFAKPGRRAIHNSGYWSGKHYIGVGASAHSYNGTQRSWNIADIDAYVASIETGQRPMEWEEIDDITRFNERVMLALRTADGLPLHTLSRPELLHLYAASAKHIASGMLSNAHGRLRLTRDALFISNTIIADLMW